MGRNVDGTAGGARGAGNSGLRTVPLETEPQNLEGSPKSGTRGAFLAVEPARWSRAVRGFPPALEGRLGCLFSLLWDLHVKLLQICRHCCGFNQPTLGFFMLLFIMLWFSHFVLVLIIVNCCRFLFRVELKQTANLGIFLSPHKDKVVFKTMFIKHRLQKATLCATTCVVRKAATFVQPSHREAPIHSQETKK